MTHRISRGIRILTSKGYPSFNFIISMAALSRYRE